MWRNLSRSQKLLTTVTATAAAGSAALYLNNDQRRPLPSMLLTRNQVAYAEAQQQDDDKPKTFWNTPSREEMIKRLDNEQEEYDLLIVGGGATGAGTAVDAATRGLKVALVERDDFASGMHITLLYPFMFRIWQHHQ